MTGAEFMATWFNWMLVFAVACAPFQLYIGILKLLRGKDGDAGDDPTGCAIFGLALFALAPFIGWWVYHNFAVVWK